MDGSATTGISPLEKMKWMLTQRTRSVWHLPRNYVYTIEGNTSDTCAERWYPIGYYEILGYGVPAY